MVKPNKFNKSSPQTQNEAMKVAMATQRPGQTKEQTKLIAQGIQKGISLYKKQQKSKSREQNKNRHKTSHSHPSKNIDDSIIYQAKKSKKQPNLPWILLIVSWLGFIYYFYITSF